MICKNGHSYEIPSRQRGCPICVAARKAEWSARNRQAENKRKADIIAQKIETGAWAAYKRDYYARNPGKRQAGFTRIFLRSRTPKWADHVEIEKKYTEAALKTAATGVPHQVDHIVPLRGALVSGLHVETNLQVLTESENRAKSNRF